MIQTNIKDIEKDFSHYIDEVSSGEKVIICKDDKPIAEITPLPSNRNGKRPYGLCEGEVSIADDFDAPLPEDIVQSFEK